MWSLCGQDDVDDHDVDDGGNGGEDENGDDGDGDGALLGRSGHFRADYSS